MPSDNNKIKVFFRAMFFEAKNVKFIKLYYLLFFIIKFAFSNYLTENMVISGLNDTIFRIINEDIKISLKKIE